MNPCAKSSKQKKCFIAFMKSSMNEIEIVFEKIGHNGVSIGKYNGKIVFAYGILPGERAKILITGQKKNFIQGQLVEILEKSNFRVKPLEDHYLSCSPWQSFDYKYQIDLKRNILEEIYLKFAKTKIKLENFFPSSKLFSHRTKIEYSFLEKEGKYYLAFYQRGNPFEKIKLYSGCKLIKEDANKIAFELLDKINKEDIKDLKSLIIRVSQKYDDIHMALLGCRKDQKFEFIQKKLSGFSFIYSKKESPASNFDEILNEWGREYIREKILNLEIRYHYSSFFQNNIELFEKALNIMRENSEGFNKVVDLYAGVGIIGLSLGDFCKEVFSIEIENLATQYAQINARLNSVQNFTALNLPAEKIPKDILEAADLVILDPPRAGLNKKLINLILDIAPQYIFYLSCNPITQARDFNILKDKYKIKKIYGFDFYPNTPHIESLLILTRQNRTKNYT
jgi:23S rRNA (uracil1939-C5)-methyltransferase